MNKKENMERNFLKPKLYENKEKKIEFFLKERITLFEHDNCKIAENKFLSFYYHFIK